MPLGLGFCCRERGLLVPNRDSSERPFSEFPAALAEVSVEKTLQLRLPLPPSQERPSAPHSASCCLCLRLGFLVPGPLQWAKTREIPSKLNKRPRSVESSPLFNILTMMQTGINRLLLNSIKLEDKNYTEEHAASTAWTTSQRAWGGCQSFEKVLERMGHLAEISSIESSEVGGGPSFWQRVQ